MRQNAFSITDSGVLDIDNFKKVNDTQGENIKKAQDHIRQLKAEIDTLEALKKYTIGQEA